MCSPPWGSCATSNRPAVAASTNSTPIWASCTSGQRRSVQVSSKARSTAATPAASCRDLGNGEVDEDNAAPEHLGAERDAGGQHQ
jgi:hypothetical protein